MNSPFKMKPIAHHVKNVPVDTEILIEPRDLPILYLPKKKPKVLKNSHRPSWYVCYTGYTEFGEISRIRLYKDFEGKTLDTETKAQRLADYIYSLKENGNNDNGNE